MRTTESNGRLVVWTGSRQGDSGLNEDAFVANSEACIYGAIDGVTAMEKYEHPDHLTSAYIASRILADNLRDDMAGLDLKTAIMRANAELLGRMKEAGIDLSAKWKRWGAVFAVFQVKENAIEYAQGGDSLLFARYTDGTIRELSRNQVARFDSVTLDLKRRLTEEGTLAPEQIRIRLREQSVKNREWANVKNGYAVLNGDPALALHMNHGSIPRSGICKLYAVTDGMFHLIENDTDPGKWQTLFDRLDEVGIEAYMDELAAEENLDPDCRKYVRHKKSDDKTVVIVQL